MSTITIIALIIVAMYFLPTIVSNSNDRSMVFVINLFLGWTFIGWVVALAIAVRPNR